MSTGIALVGGAIVGSAAGAALHRWPTGRTLLDPPRSSCEACDVPLRARDLIPVVSWLVSRGCCRTCGASIDPRLLLLEVVSALGAALVLRAHGATLTAALLTVGIVAVSMAALVDIEHRIIPDRLTVPLGALGLVVIPVVAGPERWLTVTAWALGVPCVLLVLNRSADMLGAARPIGGGDVKLLVGLLALSGVAPLGPPALLLGAVILAGSVALVGLLMGRVTRRTRLPFAPALAGAFLPVVVAPGRVPHVILGIGGLS